MPLKLRTSQGYKNFIQKPPAGAEGLAYAKLFQSEQKSLLIIVDDVSRLEPLKEEIVFYLGADDKVHSFPDWETLPYDAFSPHQDIVSQRLKFLYRIQSTSPAILLTSLSAALQRLAPRHYINSNCFDIRTGQNINLQELKRVLTASGYRITGTVNEHGEMAIRGSIVDIFPMGLEQPIRVELFDDEVESLRFFDPETQLTTGKIERFEVLPGREFPTDEAAIKRFRQNWRSQFDTDLKLADVYNEVSKARFPAGIEYFLPLFHQHTESLFDYLNDNACFVVTDENLSSSLARYWQDLNERYQQRAHDVRRPILPPQSIFMPENEFFSQLGRFAQVITATDAENSLLELGHLPNIAINTKQKDPLDKLKREIEIHDKSLLIAESGGREQALIELTGKHALKLKHITSWQDFLSADKGHYVCTGPVLRGFKINRALVIAESDLFGQQILHQRNKRHSTVSPDQLIHSLAELKPGDPVVHIDQGVGRYQGLQTLQAGGQTSEFLTLEYSGGDKLYIPVQDLHLIHRYSGTEPELAPWHRLGSESWSKAKQKAMEKARDTAAELLDIYARRAATQGLKHQYDEADYARFCAEFAYDPTPDQAQAIDAVIKDMTSNHPMDRLVCGDVGFGKTEVAMRAAFIAVQSNTQVAMLVPTTLLAEQHFQSFCDRFANWPVNIGVLSRFQSKKEQEHILQRLESGQLDIVIGTHRLLLSKPKFSNLGLLIVDEEHRFGVRQKDILKSYRSKVDILTLTATPIPRTLNMSMQGMRDLSIIATPPTRRLAIKTFVRQRDTALIREAIQREVHRGGQVYFLHNSVESIQRVANEISEIFPGLNVVVAHGQMRERELESVMKDFYHHRYHVLVCTTIIETGIDVPTANTIIIDRADKLGLAQLHQLRGRVGRSHHQAYAYLLIPHPKSITKDAQKRLQAIEELEDLGAGFILATHDLEIRGAGELLGDEQSGHMQTIGFSLYSELLERAIKALKDDQQPSLEELTQAHTEIDLGESALLPESYVPDVGIRLELYKRIASCKSQTELDSIQVELIDRFGLLPDAAKNLLEVAALKIRLTPLGILKLEASDSGLNIEFDAQPKINTERLITMIQSNPSTYRLERGSRLKVSKPLKNRQHKLQTIHAVIESLTK